MERRDFLKTVGAGTAGLAAPTPLVAGADSPGADNDRPNILIMISDDLTYHDLGCMGNRDVQTPNLDRLASEGLLFRRAFNSSPMCAPTRMSLYTGIHPVRNGAYPNHSRVYPDTRSLPHYLDEFGYQSGIIGKRHEAPLDLFPFEDLGGRHHDTGKGVDLDLSTVRSFMEENQSTPWSLVVSSNQPHVPWNRGVGYPYAPDALVVSHPSLPYGTVLLLSRPDADRHTFARVVDRGPLEQDVLLDVSAAVAEQLGIDPDATPTVALRVVWVEGRPE